MSADEEQKRTKAELIKSLWEALVAPDWDYANLVEFGKLIYARTALKDVPKKKFDDLLPFLAQIADGLSQRLEVAPKKAPAPAASPATGDQGGGAAPAAPNTAPEPEVP